MNIYHSGSMTLIKELIEEGYKLPPMNTLISFLGSQSIDDVDYAKRVFLDCGAYTAFTQNKEIEITDYIELVLKIEAELDVIAALDVIGDGEQSFKNFKAMWDEGIQDKLLPCVHYGVDLEWIDRYLEFTPYIGLGGVANAAKSFGKNMRRCWLDTVFDKYGDRAKFHGYGIHEVKLLKRYPWHTVDGSSASFNARLGGIRTPHGFFVLIEDSKPPDNLWLKPPKIRDAVIQYITDLGVNIEDARLGGEVGHKYRLFITLHFFHELEQQLTEQHKQIEQTNRLF